MVLDNTSFKALSTESRVSILKNLGERRMTLSELSKRLHLESSTIKEHCNVLSHADLIKQIDDGHKWKYYELTQKGKQIVAPSFMDEVKVLIVLCVAFVFFSGILIVALGGNMGIYSSQSLSAPSLSAALPDSAFNSAKETAATQTLLTSPAVSADRGAVTDTTGLNFTFVGGTILFTLLFGIFLGSLFVRRKHAP